MMSGRRLPGTIGYTDTEPIDAGTAPRISMSTPAPSSDRALSPATALDVPLSGGIPHEIGQASVVRIPVPGTNGLCIELRPRGRVPAGGSTSTLFFQDAAGGRHLRLDYGYNVKTRTIDYHRNQKGTFAALGIADHAPVGEAGEVAHQAARCYRYAGGVFVVVGVLVDTVSIVQASNPMRRASEVIAGWAGAWAGCEVLGAGGASIGLLASPIGSAVGGVLERADNAGMDTVRLSKAIPWWQF